MPYASEVLAQRPVAPGLRVRLVVHQHLAAAIALDAQEPRREGAERLAQRLGACW